MRSDLCKCCHVAVYLPLLPPLLGQHLKGCAKPTLTLGRMDQSLQLLAEDAPEAGRFSISTNNSSTNSNNNSTNKVCPVVLRAE